ncbi:DUF4856 domain-containing protein [Neolewinella aurantiaca]|uniref:DUF4856 domain-containing protein n=1 Tax=Neolewinella aurantiaca TaxID=2602767 RepID=A0A5C7FW19_9BACT|nr:DUF4856 domain-containing protein [Neolewinella aurantiaca]TXF89799.1 DUF4856 domain-containing protein [Neolewinella aurantiaca]
MKTSLYLFAGLFLLFFATSCEDDDDITPSLDVPTTYAFSRDGASTVSFSGQSERIAMAEELVSSFTDFSQTTESLNNMFTNAEGTNPFTDAELNASTKSIRSKVAASSELFAANSVLSAEIKEDFDGWISAQVNEVFPAQSEVAEAGTPGQIADGSSVRYVNAWGLEYNQAFAKSLIGGLMYDQIANHYLSPLQLDSGTRRTDNTAGIVETDESYTAMEHRWDEAYGYLFGASEDETGPLTDLGSADNFLNKYLGRVNDDEDFSDTAANIEAAFRRGRAAIVAADYTERDAQASIIKDELSKVIRVRAAYYLMQGKAALEDSNMGGAFHDLSEGYGFVYSLRFIDGTAGEDIAESYLTTLRNADGNGFWDIDPAALETIASEIASSGGFSLEAAAN